MAQILPIRRYKAFDPDATWAMGAAYDKAIGTIHPDAESQFVVRELIAKRIIGIAQKGVVDRDQFAHRRPRRPFFLAFPRWVAHNKSSAHFTLVPAEYCR